MYAWRRPEDPTIYGTLDIDVAPALDYLQGLSAASGVKVTLTHLVGKALADAIARRPEVNAVIRRRHAIYQRDSIDIFFQVAFDGGEDLSGAKIDGADRKDVVTVARELHAAVGRVRDHQDSQFTHRSQRLARLPGPLRGAALRALEFTGFDLGLDLSALGLPYDPFGSAMVTNVGMFGLSQGFAPLVPFSRVPIVVTVGAVEVRPCVVNGAVQSRPMMTLGAALDHRLIDGYQAGHLASHLRTALQAPGTG